MKRLLLFILFLLPILASAQVVHRVPVVYQTGAPTGTCTEMIVIDRVTGTQYECVSTAWVPNTTVSSLTTPVVIGGTGTTSTLKLRSTSGVGVAGADIIFQTGNNGATEVGRFLNNGRFGIGTATPGALLDVKLLANSHFALVDATGGFGFAGPVLDAFDDSGVLVPMVLNASKFGFWTGSVGIGNTSPGATLDVTGNGNFTSASATALTVGRQGATTPVLTVNGSVASQTDGVEIKGNAVGNGVTLTATSSGSNAPINLVPKGTGAVVFGTTNTLSAGFQSGPGSFVLNDSSNAVEIQKGGTRLAYFDSNTVIQPSGTLQFSSTNFNVSTVGALTTATVAPSSPAVTVGSGTGITVNNSGEIRTLTYKVTITNAALSAAATTADVTIATLPAKTQLNGIWADVTQVFTGGAVATATMVCGKTAGGAEYLASFNVFSATIQRGLADADLGTAMVRSAAVQGGDMPSWSATTAVQCRITTSGANTSALSQGSVTFYLRTTKLP